MLFGMSLILIEKLDFFTVAIIANPTTRKPRMANETESPIQQIPLTWVKVSE